MTEMKRQPWGLRIGRTGGGTKVRRGDMTLDDPAAAIDATAWAECLVLLIEILRSGCAGCFN